MPGRAEETGIGRSPAMESSAAAMSELCEQSGADLHLLVCSVQPKVDHIDPATAVGGLPTGAPVAANCGGRVGEARSSGGATWCEKHDSVVGSGGGRLKETERWWPWSSVGWPWRWRASVTQSMGRRALRAEHDAAKAVVLAMGCKGAQSWRNSGGGTVLHSVAAMVVFVRTT
jgi:hypothetical protein